MDSSFDGHSIDQAARDAELRKRIAANADSVGSGGGEDSTLATLHSGGHDDPDLINAGPDRQGSGSSNLDLGLGASEPSTAAVAPYDGWSAPVHVPPTPSASAAAADSRSASVSTPPTDFVIGIRPNSPAPAVPETAPSPATAFTTGFASSKVEPTAGRSGASRATDAIPGKPTDEAASLSARTEDLDEVSVASAPEDDPTEEPEPEARSGDEDPASGGEAKSPVSDTATSESDGAVPDGDIEHAQVETPVSNGPQASQPDGSPIEADNSGPSDFDEIALDDVNEAPIEPVLDTSTVAENAAGAVIGQLSAADPDSGDSVTFAVDDPRFEVVGETLKLRDGVSLDHETEARVPVEITATDSAGLTTVRTVEIAVDDVNEAPESLAFTPEATGHGDTATLTVRLGGDAYKGNPRYEIIVDGESIAKGEVTWAKPRTENSETEWRDIAFDVPRGEDGIGTVEVRYFNDKFDGDKAHDRNLIVDRIELDGHVMEAEGSGVHYAGPNIDGRERMAWNGKLVFDTSGIEAQPLSAVAENELGAVVGRLSADDPDVGETFNYAVSDSRFEVVDGVLKLTDNVSLDHEAAETIDLHIEATDSGGHVISQDLEILVQDRDEAPHGITLDDVAVSEAERGAAVGRIDATSGDGGAVTYEVSDARFAVVDGELRLKPEAVLDFESEPQVHMDITATNEIGLSTMQGVDIDVSDVAETVLPIDVHTGFRLDYFDYDGWMNTISDVDWDATPAHRDVAQSIDFEVTDGSFWKDGTADRFAVRATGKIEVDENGSYDFRTHSDDGSVVRIDGREVVVNDGDHGMRFASGSIELEPGSHSVEVYYFENDGVAGLTFEMRGPDDSDWGLVEAQSDLAMAQNGAMPLGLDIDGAGEVFATSLHGLPGGSVVMDENNAVISDGSAVDLSGWNLEGLEITPPSTFSGSLDISIRGNGLESGGQPFEFDRSITIEVIPDAENPRPEAAESAPDDMPEQGWVDALDAPHTGASDGADMSAMDYSHQNDTSDEHHMMAFDRIEI